MTSKKKDKFAFAAELKASSDKIERDKLLAMGVPKESLNGEKRRSGYKIDVPVVEQERIANPQRANAVEEVLKSVYEKQRKQKERVWLYRLI